MAERMRCGVSESWRYDKTLANGRNSQPGFTNNALSDRRPPCHTSSTVNKGTTATVGGRGSSGRGSDNSYNSLAKDLVKHGFNGGAGCAAAERSALSLSVAPRESHVLSAGRLSGSSVCTVSASMKERAAPLRPMKPTPQLSAIACSSGLGMIAGKRACASSVVEPAVSARVPSMLISPRLSNVVDRRRASLRCDGAVSSSSSLMARSSHSRVLSSTRGTHFALTKGSTAHENAETRRSAVTRSASPLVPRAAAARVGKSAVAGPTATGKGAAAAVMDGTRTTNKVLAVRAEASARKVCELTSFAVVPHTDSGNVPEEGVVPQAADADLCPGLDFVSRRLSFDDGNIRADSDCGVGHPPRDVEVSIGAGKARDPKQKVMTVATSMQQGKERSKTVTTPVQLHARRPTVAPASMSFDNTDAEDSSKHVAGSGATFVDEVKPERSTEENDAKVQEWEKGINGSFCLGSYVGAPVGESGQKPFIRRSVRGVNSGRAKLSVMPLQATTKDHRLQSVLRPTYDLCSGRYKEKPAEMKPSRCHSVGPWLLSPSPRVCRPPSNRRGDSVDTHNSVGANSDDSGNHRRSIDNPRAASVIHSGAGGRLERAEHQPIPPASQWRRSCSPSVAGIRAKSSNRCSSVAISTSKRATSPDAAPSVRYSFPLNGLKPTPFCTASPAANSPIPSACANGTEIMSASAEPKEGLCNLALHRHDRQRDAKGDGEVDAHDGRRQRGGSLDITYLCLPRCASGRLAPQPCEGPREAGRPPQQRHTVPSLPFRRSATAPAMRHRLSGRDSSVSPIRAGVTIKSPTSTASVLLRVRNVLNQRRARVQASLQDRRRGADADGGDAVRAAAPPSADQQEQGLKFDRGVGSGSGSSGGCCGVSSSDTPVEMTERAHKSHERSEEEEEKPSLLSDPHRGSEPQVESLCGVPSGVEDIEPRKVVGAGVLNDHAGGDRAAADPARVEDVARGCARGGYCNDAGYEADYCDDDNYDDSDYSDEDCWWFFEHFWSGPAIIAHSPSFVPPLKLVNLHVPNDEAALVKYAIAMPTAVPRFLQGPAFSTPGDGDARLPANSVSMAACSGGSRGRPSCEFRWIKTSSEERKGREISIKILLLETAERRCRRQQHQEQAIAWRALLEQQLRELEKQGL